MTTFSLKLQALIHNNKAQKFIEKLIKWMSLWWQRMGLIQTKRELIVRQREAHMSEDSVSLFLASVCAASLTPLMWHGPESCRSAAASQQVGISLSAAGRQRRMFLWCLNITTAAVSAYTCTCERTGIHGKLFLLWLIVVVLWITLGYTLRANILKRDVTHSPLLITHNAIWPTKPQPEIQVCLCS